MAEFFFDRQSCRAIDREAMRRYGIPSIVLMENAAIALRDQALKLLHLAHGEAAAPTRRDPQVLIVCGSGNNGGDGYALARHLHNAECAVDLLAMGVPRQGTDARSNFDICVAMKLPIVARREDLSMDARSAALIVDAIFGTGLDRPIDPATEHCNVIEWMNALGPPVLAADLPSGLDCDTGQPLGIAVQAAATVSFVGRKKGFIINPDSRRYTGEVTIGDIGVPRELLEEFGTAI